MVGRSGAGPRSSSRSRRPSPSSTRMAIRGGCRRGREPPRRGRLGRRSRRPPRRGKSEVRRPTTSTVGPKRPVPAATPSPTTIGRDASPTAEGPRPDRARATAWEGAWDADDDDSGGSEPCRAWAGSPPRLTGRAAEPAATSSSVEAAANRRAGWSRRARGTRGAGSGRGPLGPVNVPAGRRLRPMGGRLRRCAREPRSALDGARDRRLSRAVRTEPTKQPPEGAATGGPVLAAVYSARSTRMCWWTMFGTKLRG